MKIVLRSLALATVAGVGLLALAADPPIKPVPSNGEGEVATDGVPVGSSQASTGIAPRGAPCDPQTGVGCYTEFAQPSRGPADKYNEIDPAFAKFVDLAVLTEAMSGPNVSQLTDVALALAEGERALVRFHHAGLRADTLIATVVKLAARANDAAVLERVSKASTNIDRPQWAKLVAEAMEFAGSSRDGPMVLLDKINLESVELLDRIRRTCQEATLTSDCAPLDDLRKELATIEVDGKMKAYATELIDTALKGLGDKTDATATVLSEFLADSRQRGSRWYKVEIDTKRTGEGGTDGKIYFSMAGTTGSTRWIQLDSPGDSHEQGDTDVCFFRLEELGRPMHGWQVVVGSDESSDKWTWEMWVYELDASSGRWVEYCHIPIHTSGITHDPYFPYPPKPTGSCHHDYRDGTVRISGYGPSGVDMKEITHTDGGTLPPPDEGGNAFRAGPLFITNDYRGDVTIALYNSANLSRDVGHWPIRDGSPSTRLIAPNSQELRIGQDWEIEVIFGNGVRSPRRTVGSISTYSNGAFQIKATAIYGGR